MDRLYTPWRKEYITTLHNPQGCVLCEIQDQNDHEAMILLRTPNWYVVLNKYPYTTGHLLIVTRRHVGSLAELDGNEQSEMSGLLAKSETSLRNVYDPPGMNMGLNLGRAGGAGVQGHVHWHALPRWPGDANFVSVIGDTRMLPETLGESYERLLPQFSEG